MKPKFACADFTFPLLTHDQSLDLIAILGFEGVDVGLFENRSHLWPSREFNELKKSARKLARKLTDRGLKPADIFLQTGPDFSTLAPNHPDKSKRRKARKLFLQSLEYAATCGSKHVSALPGVYFQGEPKSDSFARCCEELNWRVEQADTFAITFAIEAHIGSIVPTPPEVRRLLDQVPGLTLTLDYTHFTRHGISDRAVEPLLSFSSHFHARGARKNKLQASVEENEVDYHRIADLMKEMKYKGYIGLEYVWVDWEGCNEVDNISETILLRDLIKSAFQ